MVRSRADFFDQMRASSKLPTAMRPTHYTAPGLRAAREAAGMTIEEVAELSGYGVGVIASLEAGHPHHTVSISRVASVIPGHNLAEIRDEN